MEESNHVEDSVHQQDVKQDLVDLSVVFSICNGGTELFSAMEEHNLTYILGSLLPLRGKPMAEWLK